MRPKMCGMIFEVFVHLEYYYDMAKLNISKIRDKLMILLVTMKERDEVFTLETESILLLFSLRFTAF